MAFPTGWTGKLQIASDATKVAGSSNLTDFPSLIADGNLTSAVYAGLQADADDLRITTDSAGTTEIPFEIVSFNQGAETCEIWAKVPSLLYASNTSLYIWYGNASALPYAATDTYGSQNVWTDYGAVYHGEVLTSDSTSHAYTLTNNGTVTSGTGKFSGCFDFGTSNSSKAMSINSNLGLTGSRSFSLWVKLTAEISSGAYTFLTNYDTTVGRKIYIKYEYNGGTRRLLFEDGRADNTNTNFTYNVTLGTSDWNHIVITHNQSNGVFYGYLNGTSIGNSTDNGTGSTAYTDRFVAGSNINIASGALSNYSNALIDEDRAIADVYTPDWITTEYNNQNSPSTFWTASTFSAAVIPVTTTLTIPSVTATYDSVRTAAVAALSTTLTLPAVTATYAAVLSASVTSLATALTLPAITATFDSVRTAAVSPLATTLTLPAVTSSYFAVLSAAVTPLVGTLTLPTPATTYVQIETSAVSPLVTTLTITGLTATATKFAGQTVPLVLTLSAFSIANKVAGWAKETTQASSWSQESSQSSSWTLEVPESGGWTKE